MYIFISYSSKDSTFVRKLAASLEFHGFSFFLDEKNITIGENIPDAVFSSIEKATHLIYVISKSSMNSKWVSDEISAANNRRISEQNLKILPVIIDNIPIPIQVKHLKHADFTLWNNEESYYKNFSLLTKSLSTKRPSSSDGTEWLSGFDENFNSIVSIKMFADQMRIIYNQLEKMYFYVFRGGEGSYITPGHWFSEATKDININIIASMIADILENPKVASHAGHEIVSSFISLSKRGVSDFVLFYHVGHTTLSPHVNEDTLARLFPEIRLSFELPLNSIYYAEDRSRDLGSNITSILARLALLKGQSQ